MEEHRFTCPTHVREFTRYRAHVDFSQDQPPAPAAVAAHGAEPTAASSAQDARAPTPAEPLPAG